MESACDIFYSICNDSGRSDIVNDLVSRLDFHALSIALLATTAAHNLWGYDRLAKEWEIHRAQILRTDHNESLSATIELSLASPTFRALGSHARDLLGVIAFFPQGIDENNLDWFFPSISNRSEIFDKFRVLSLTSRSGSFVTMLAPIRDYLCPQDPRSSPLLCTTRDHYFTRLSVDLSPKKPTFGEARWITSEDVNVEHLLDVFTSIDPNSSEVWDATFHFVDHLYSFKPRQTVLAPKMEGLPDNHTSKPECLFRLSQLLIRIGDFGEGRRVYTDALRLERQRGNDLRVAEILGRLTEANRMLGRHKEGIQWVEEALGIYERLGDIYGQTKSLGCLAAVLYADNQLGASHDAAARAIRLDPGGSQISQQVLGWVYQAKGEMEKAIQHYEIALKLASVRNQQGHLFGIRASMVKLFQNEGRPNDANAHIEQLKLYAGDNAYYVGIAMMMQAVTWFQQRRLEEAKSEVLGAIEIFEQAGVAKEAKQCKFLLQRIERAMEGEPALWQW
jgi:tetratricopeptide (TPR) repeat protein